MTDETETGRAVLGGGAACSFRLWGELPVHREPPVGIVGSAGRRNRRRGGLRALLARSVPGRGCGLSQLPGPRGTPHPTGAEATYTGTYQQAERSQKDTVYQVTVEGSAGQAVCSTTDHRTGEQAPTLVLSLPETYTLYFTGE